VYTLVKKIREHRYWYSSPTSSELNRVSKEISSKEVGRPRDVKAQAQGVEEDSVTA